MISRQATPLASAQESRVADEQHLISRSAPLVTDARRCARTVAFGLQRRRSHARETALRRCRIRTDGPSSMNAWRGDPSARLRSQWRVEDAGGARERAEDRWVQEFSCKSRFKQNVLKLEAERRNDLEEKLWGGATHRRVSGASRGRW